MNEKQKEEQIIIDEYEFNSSSRSAKSEENTQAALKALEILILENKKYLQYAQAKHFFTMTPEEEKETALHNALITVMGRAIHFEPYDAEKLAFEILQDVNLHQEARAVAKLLKLNLKAHELE
jgi:uncharacterized protein (DUF2132 family)